MKVKFNKKEYKIPPIAPYYKNGCYIPSQFHLFFERENHGDGQKYKDELSKRDAEMEKGFVSKIKR